MGRCELLLLLAVVAVASAHKYNFGKCANVKPMDNFDPDRIVGLWYVHHAMGTTSSCLTFNYTRTASGLQVVESKQLRLLDAVGLEHKYSAVGTLRENGLPGYYQASFSTNPASSRYVFMASDYDNYAGVFHCQHAGGIFHRRNVYVLSRTPDIDDIYVEKVRRRMGVADLDPENLKPIKHEECTTREESDVNVRLDGTLFDFRSMDQEEP